jgi:hypothetical protein
MRSHNLSTCADGQCVFNQSATGLTNTRHALLAAGERQSGKRDGGCDRDRGASLRRPLAPLAVSGFGSTFSMILRLC